MLSAQKTLLPLDLAILKSSTKAESVSANHGTLSNAEGTYMCDQQKTSVNSSPIKIGESAATLRTCINEWCRKREVSLSDPSKSLFWSTLHPEGFKYDALIVALEVSMSTSARIILS